ncbi:hypothetical protein LCGC14_1656450 [marine sediment metagenome]|uniref:Uncharacterized protein n=1 Tax=marine sediment metagenome TaxID=412755 RepID=A0A0F9KB50_9ZZZZ
METYCHDCDHRTNGQAPPWRWMCLKHPRLDGFGYVTRKTWDNFPPYLFCHHVNGGACPLFEPRKETKDGQRK